MKEIVGETCDALWEVLGPVYVSLPQNDEWKRIAIDFYTMWDLPNCVGAIDGKHINVFCPSNSGSLFYNYKGNYSIVLLAVCDANYTFTGIDIGAYGSQSDGGVLWNSGFGENLYGGTLDLPENDVLPGTNNCFPHYFVGDSAFPLKPFLMRPYPGTNLPPDRQIFNQRLSRARRVIENAFGILACRWRILLSPLQMSPASAEKIVKATVVLHNYVKMHDGSYCPPEAIDQEINGEVRRGLWRNEIPAPLQNTRRMGSNNASYNAFKLRDELKDYLVSHPRRTQ
ncbi:PREDICTED: putative nuclease HARBI1 [Rhagoletis zephyria]|uniref:putative nuclease HARBI1 n=1 Tax=Rhagoletis zephyria TaxID=28612 RepID=UPI000811A7D2|nr:PREDICTED: putative nuclease HARBI1 [Rhagoletis zephyria]XP_017471611.1 PREDICTED: putative nuclease HARBI1 [Rhagoletis zephyria]